MKYRRYKQKFLRLVALLLLGVNSQSLLSFYLSKPALAQKSQAAASTCAEITNPLTAEEQVYAKAAWQYFVTNYQQATGFVNSTNNYPSGTLWDMGNYLMGLNAARWLNIINQAEFDSRLNKFLTTLSSLKLFENALPNKVYNAATGELVDYTNKPVETGIGWSALDIGRLLAAFHIIRTCHPQYEDWLKGIVGKWQIARSLKDGQLYGATVLPDQKTLLVQEGRMGYEEYAARGYELWGFKASKAVSLDPYKFVEINGLKIPVDTRSYQDTNANNYVVSESYILDGVEFGLKGYLADYAASVFEVQKRRFESTGELTAVSEDNIEQEPYFLYNTVFANGEAWATITEANKPYPQLRTISTKAAIGWRYLYPNSAYAQLLFDAVKNLRSPEGNGFYAGYYPETKQPNKSLTANTNGSILEIFYYKARGNRPLIDSSLVTFAPGQPTGNITATTNTPLKAPTERAGATPTASNPPSIPPTAPSSTAPSTPSTVPAENIKNTTVTVVPIPPVGNPQPEAAPKLTRQLTPVERRYAKAAWSYFIVNFQSKTGLVSDRSDLKAASLWGLGDYISALQAARSLNIISSIEFDQRTRQLLAALGKLPLYAGELPTRGYDINTLQPVDYGGNPIANGTGWSGLDLGRLLAALYNLKSAYPEYTAAIDRIPLDWSYLRVVRDGKIANANIVKDSQGRQRIQVNPATRLGYEEYAARAFQLWGFDANRSEVGGDYETQLVEGIQVPTYRHRADTKTEVKENKFTLSDPFLLYGLEMGFDPQMRSLAEPIFRAQAQRYRRTGKFTASATTLITTKPYIVNSTVVGQGQAWATLTADGISIPDSRTVSTAVAFAYRALYPKDDYAQQLWQATTDLYNPVLGYFEGFNETTGQPITSFTSSTNSIVLQSLLYTLTNQRPLIRPTTMNSPWWQAIKQGDSGRGLPENATQKVQLFSDNFGTYWAPTPDKALPSLLGIKRK